MEDHTIKAIILDLGNVLIDFNHRIGAEKISKFTDKSGKEIFDLFFDSELTALFEEGKISPQNFFLEVKEKLNLGLEYREFVSIWNEIFFLTEKNRGVYKLAKSLKMRYRVALLSNVNILHFEYLKKNFPIFDAFHYIITSFELGVRKPDPAIYQKALEILDVSPRNVFYTDDRAELIQKAAELGIRGFIFTGIEGLHKNLLESGINLN